MAPNDLTIYSREYSRKLVVAKLEQAGLPVAMIGVAKLEAIADKIYDDGIMFCKAGDAVSAAIKKKHESGDATLTLNLRTP